jgi:hypothetical protein
MPKSCVQLWDNLRETVGTNWGGLSTKCMQRYEAASTSCAQWPVIPLVVPWFHPQLFTQIIAFSPLIEQKFYPLSTEPIIRTTI